MTSAPKSMPLARGWALVVPAAQAAGVARLRRHVGIEIAEEAQAVWLRGRAADEATAKALLTLPATARYEWDEDGTLRPVGAILPTRPLPTLAWRAIRDWAQVQMPIANVPANLPAPVCLQLIPSAQAVPANALLATAAGFFDWVEAAPAIRLAPLRFAANSNGQVLVLGAPLPPLPGRPAVENAGVILPAGFALHPSVPATVIRRVLNAPDDALVWWDEAGPQLLNRDVFVRAQRSAARLSRPPSA